MTKLDPSDCIITLALLSASILAGMGQIPVESWAAVLTGVMGYAARGLKQ